MAKLGTQDRLSLEIIDILKEAEFDLGKATAILKKCSLEEINSVLEKYTLKQIKFAIKSFTSEDLEIILASDTLEEFVGQLRVHASGGIRFERDSILQINHDSFKISESTTMQSKTGFEIVYKGVEHYIPLNVIHGPFEVVGDEHGGLHFTPSLKELAGMVAEDVIADDGTL